MRETESGPSTLKTLQVSWGDGQALKETHCGPEAVAQREELQVLRDGETSVACRDRGVFGKEERWEHGFGKMQNWGRGRAVMPDGAGSTRGLSSPSLPPAPPHHGVGQ